jgi:orotate phosphoribosyltransferase
MAESPTARAEHDRLVRIVRDKGLTSFDEPVELASGALSRDFVDAKRALGSGPDLAVACRAVAALADRLGVAFDAVGGMTMGADMFAHGVAVLAGCDWFVVRKQPKDRGTRQQIEGAPIGPGRRLLLVEDTVTTGGSSLEALAVVRATGAEVVLATALVDRGDSAADRFAAAGVTYEPLLTYRDLGIEPVIAPS